MANLTRHRLERMGFAALGRDLMISDRASFYNCGNIRLGNNVRIDDFCILSAGDGGISIQDFVHVAVYTSLIGSGKITLSDFCNLSSRVSIYSSSDDFSGETMTNPMIPKVFKSVRSADVLLCKHVIVGSGTVILPGVTLNEGVAIGALSLVEQDCESFGVYAGIPAKFRKQRKRNLLELEKRFVSSLA